MGQSLSDLSLSALHHRTTWFIWGPSEVRSAVGRSVPEEGPPVMLTTGRRAGRPGIAISAATERPRSIEPPHRDGPTPTESGPSRQLIHTAGVCCPLSQYEPQLEPPTQRNIPPAQPAYSYKSRSAGISLTPLHWRTLGQHAWDSE